MNLKNRVEKLEDKKGDPFLDRPWARVTYHDWEDVEEAIDQACKELGISRETHNFRCRHVVSVEYVSEQRKRHEHQFNSLCFGCCS